MCVLSNRKFTKTVFGQGSAPYPAEGACDAPQTPQSDGERERHPLPFPSLIDASISAPLVPRFLVPRQIPGYASALQREAAPLLAICWVRVSSPIRAVAWPSEKGQNRGP